MENVIQELWVMDGNFNDGFQPLTCDEDVLLFGKDTYTVGRFKELVFDSIKQQKVYSFPASDRHSQRKHYLTLETLNAPYTVDRKLRIYTSESNWSSCSDNIECQLLKIAFPGWKNGNLRIRTKVTFFPDEYIGKSYNHDQEWDYLKTEIKVDLEFSPDEPDEYQSPLDKLRQLESDL